MKYGKYELVNLTNHDINELQSKIVIPKSENVAKVERYVVFDDSIKGVPIKKEIWGKVTGLPDPKPNTYYIVSVIVLKYVKLFTDRTDVLCPGKVIRDGSGVPVACDGFNSFV